MGYPVNPDGSFEYDHPAPTPAALPERIWHVDGILAPFDKSTTLDGSRVTYATTEAEAVEKVVTACRSVRGEKWGWVGQVRIYPHYAWDDPDCPVCKRRDAITHCHEGDCPNMAEQGTRYCAEHLASNHEWWARHAIEERMSHDEYQDGIDVLYQPATISPHTLTDPQAGYGEPPSQEALDTVEQLQAYLDTLVMDEWSSENAKADLARWFDAFAAQAVAAREAAIVAALEHQAEVWERMKDMTPSAELRASVYRTAINYITK